MDIHTRNLDARVLNLPPGRILLPVFGQLLWVWRSIPAVLDVYLWASITFEDPLGQTSRLPFTLIQSWRVFNAMLRDKFEGSVFQHIISQKRFCIIAKGNASVLVMNRKKWMECIRPGMIVQMFVVISNVQVGVDRSGFTYRQPQLVLSRYWEGFDSWYVSDGQAPKV